MTRTCQKRKVFIPIWCFAIHVRRLALQPASKFNVQRSTCVKIHDARVQGILAELVVHPSYTCDVRRYTVVVFEIKFQTEILASMSAYRDPIFAGNSPRLNVKKIVLGATPKSIQYNQLFSLRPFFLDFKASRFSSSLTVATWTSYALPFLAYPITGRNTPIRIDPKAGCM
ncbi:hypothetical protein JOM56_014955 [Amanita muscaria]